MVLITDSENTLLYALFTMDKIQLAVFGAMPLSTEYI
jgi:hypothetical protein